MANRYRGNEHKYGVVVGGYTNSVCIIIAGVILVFSGEGWLIGLTLIGWGVLYYLDTKFQEYFRKGIKFSKGYTYETAHELYDNLQKAKKYVVIISLILSIISIIYYSIIY